MLVPLPVEKILRALPLVAKNRRASARSFAELSLAICTTDTRPKTAATWFKMARKRIHFVGCGISGGEEGALNVCHLTIKVRNDITHMRCPKVHEMTQMIEAMDAFLPAQ